MCVVLRLSTSLLCRCYPFPSQYLMSINVRNNELCSLTNRVSSLEVFDDFNFISRVLTTNLIVNLTQTISMGQGYLYFGMFLFVNQQVINCECYRSSSFIPITKYFSGWVFSLRFLSDTYLIRKLWKIKQDKWKIYARFFQEIFLWKLIKILIILERN